MSSTPPKELYVLDLFALIFRSYYALLGHPMRNADGQNTTCIYFIAQTILTLLEQRRVFDLVAACESTEPTFRKQEYPLYKAHRQEAPSELVSQIPLVKALLKAFGVLIYEASGYEADDVMATLAQQATQNQMFCWLISQDKDMQQVLDSPSVGLLQLKGKQFQELLGKDLKQEKGLDPSQVIDYLSLLGDSSDNVPGVKGIGKKTALSLLERYKSILGIYQHLHEFSPSIQNKLLAGKGQLALSQRLVTLKRDLSLKFIKNKEAFSLAQRADIPALYQIFEKHSMSSLEKRLSKVLSQNGQGRVFDSMTQEVSVETSSQDAESKQYRLFVQDLGSDDDPSRGGGQKEPHYHRIRDEQDLQTQLKLAAQASLVAFDTETSSLERDSFLVGFSFAYQENRAFYVNVAHSSLEEAPLSSSKVREILKEFFATPSLKIVGHNFKFDAKVLLRFGISLSSWYADTMIAAYVLNPGSRYSLDILATHFLSCVPLSFSETLARAGLSKKDSFCDVPLDLATFYGAQDADLTLRLYQYLEKELQKQDMLGRFFDLEMPFNWLLHQMELQGIWLEVQLLKNYEHDLAKTLHTLQQTIFDKVGYSWNLNSTKQLQTVFGELKIPLSRKIKTGFSTDTSVLESLQHEFPLVKDVLNFRLYTKLMNTYIRTLPLLTDPKTQRLHTQFNQTGASTGRISSSNPNLQNIPLFKEFNIRKAFKSPPGLILLSADYSQIELVVLAHLSKDPALMEVYRQGQDVHTQTAAFLFNKAQEEVSSIERRTAKTINFGIIYRMSAFRLAKTLDIGYSKAKEFIDQYFEKYAGINIYMQTIINEAYKTGHITTLLGHKRPIYGIRSSNSNERQAAERMAVNTPIQGSAADIVKLSMLALNRRLHQEKKAAKLLLQVHDEVVLELPVHELEEVAYLVKQEMEGAYPLDVPLKVDIEVGPSWGDLKPYRIGPNLEN